MDNANKELSKRLYGVLDVKGASEYIRKKSWEYSMILEITKSFDNRLYPLSPYNISYYIVGSTCEGTTTPDFYSDHDIIYCNEETHVVEHLFESKQQGISYLILTEEDTKPGYVCLEIVKDKCPLTVGVGSIFKDRCFINGKGKVCVKNNVQFVGPKSCRNGPADTIPASDDYCQIDNVYALRCRWIPSSAKSWLHRIRKHGWPSQKQLAVMDSYGCFFVGVGHPHNNNTSSEWRISFTLQERDLMSSLNETQHKCYILLKMIKKDIIEQHAGESISSYHCKTSLFYTIENSHIQYWTNNKLILCVQQCLKRLFIWVKAKYCPNYFIPEQNMFDKPSVMKSLDKIEYVLNDILDMKFFIYTYM